MLHIFQTVLRSHFLMHVDQVTQARDCWQWEGCSMGVLWAFLSTGAGKSDRGFWAPLRPGLATALGRSRCLPALAMNGVEQVRDEVELVLSRHVSLTRSPTTANTSSFGLMSNKQRHTHITVQYTH